MEASNTSHANNSRGVDSPHSAAARPLISGGDQATSASDAQDNVTREGEQALALEAEGVHPGSKYTAVLEGTADPLTSPGSSSRQQGDNAQPHCLPAARSMTRGSVASPSLATNSTAAAASMSQGSFGMSSLASTSVASAAVSGAGTPLSAHSLARPSPAARSPAGLDRTSAPRGRMVDNRGGLVGELQRQSHRR